MNLQNSSTHKNTKGNPKTKYNENEGNNIMRPRWMILPKRIRQPSFVEVGGRHNKITIRTDGKMTEKL